MFMDREIKAVLFDGDGVIFNSLDAWYDAFNDVLENHGMNKVTAEDFDERTTGGYLDEDIIIYFGKIDEKKLEKIREEYMDAFIKKFDQISLYPQAKEVIARSKASGCKLGYVTNTPMYIVEKLLRFFDLIDQFDTVVTGDMVLNRKPFPDIVLLACKKLNVSPIDCVLVEDSIKGIEAGGKAGIGLLIATITTTETPKLIKAGADIIIDNLNDLFKHI